MKQRRAIFVQGTVQGVGFRPFIHRLATTFGLSGFVTNHGGEVYIEVEGLTPQIEQLLATLTQNPPPLARIDNISAHLLPLASTTDFEILESTPNPHAAIAIAPDIASCDDCLAELFDSQNRRFRYPFLNCTNCGPRLTIVTGSPYDRARTTMAAFPLCEACRMEYDDPADRRFHAQPTACPICGPRLAAADAAGNPLDVPNPIAWFADALRAGHVGAMKGVGGYHLVCDASNDAAIQKLRQRKHREERPFAVMVPTIGDAEQLCELTEAERLLLAVRARPIVLVQKRCNTSLSHDIAPGNPTLGLMLPYTPLHHLLLRDINIPLVVTSGNRSDEPIAITEPEVFEVLAGIADLFLTHNRPIHVRCDDSVTRIIAGAESPIRRSRGYAPEPISLPLACHRPILAVGGQLKSTFALGQGTRAIMSHHLGDLDNFEAFRAFERDVALYEQLFAIHPRIVAHDLHPDYASTRYAQKRAALEGCTLVPVQHHHAHMAGCMAEHGLSGPVIGVIFDGTGLGTDGSIWGGEILVGDFRRFRRAAHLRAVGMPGGERAVREPWRMAVSQALDAGIDLSPALKERIGERSVRTAEQLLRTRFNSPLTSSAGRLFDAVACLVTGRDRVTFEGHAAMELEWLAEMGATRNQYPFEIRDATGGEDGASELDTRPTIREIVHDVCAGVAPAMIARQFHNTLAAMIGETCSRLHAATGLDQIILSGGVFMNALLQRETQTQLLNRGLFPLIHRLMPANDGNVSVGQLSIAAALIGENDVPGNSGEGR